MKTILLTILTLALGICFVFSVWAKDDKSEFTFGTDPEVSAIRPRPPVEIKVKRYKDGTYSWEIEGDDADAILRADKKLREKLKTETEK